MAPRTIRKGKSIIIAGYRVKIIDVRGDKVTFGFEVASGPLPSDVVEIGMGADEKALTFRPLSV